MPRSGAKLEDPVIRDFEAWIRHGAPDPRDFPPTQEELTLDTQWEAIMDRRKQWWSFQPISSEGIDNSVLHPVDALIQEKLEEVGLEAAPQGRQGNPDASLELRLAWPSTITGRTPQLLARPRPDGL